MILKKLRELNLNYLFILVSFISLGAGLKFENSPDIVNTWLCYDRGCVIIQGYTALCIAVLLLLLGVYGLITSKKF